MLKKTGEMSSVENENKQKTFMNILVK